MQIEELNKTQIILLTLLVSFVTSIATGIVTVTLMDQAPADVVRTVNRVVERTVERVVPGPAAVVTEIKEVPVIITEESLVMKVINNSSPSVVKIVNEKDHTVVLGNAFAVGPNRLITTSNLFPVAAVVATSSRSNRNSQPVVGPNPADYVIINERSQIAAIESIVKSADGRFYILTLKPIDLTSSESVNISSGLKFSANPAVVGQTVVALGYDSSGESNVSVGIVSSASAVSTSTPVAKIATNAASSGNIGAPLLNINGEVVGLNEGVGVAAPASEVKKALTI